MKRSVIALLAALLPAASMVLAQATRPSSAGRADQEMERLLKPTGPGAQAIQPAPGGETDRTTGPGAVAPGAPVLSVVREGTLIVDRTGRMLRSADGQQMEFTFEADGTAMKDPPMVILPNLKLMAIENEITRSSRDLRFRISGLVTEYRGRNYILLEKVVVVPDVDKPF